MLPIDTTVTNGRLFGIIPDPSLTLRVRVTNGDAHPRWYLERTLAWTAYAVETIVDDALHAGAGGRVEVTVPSDASFAAVAWMSARFASLRARGVKVRLLMAGRALD